MSIWLHLLILKVSSMPNLSYVLVQQDKSTVDMDLLKPSILHALSVMLLALVLVHCQTPVRPEEEQEIEMGQDGDNATATEIECPLDCSCTDEAVDCAGVDLTEFPEELSEKTRQLSLQVLYTRAIQPGGIPERSFSKL